MGIIQGKIKFYPQKFWSIGEMEIDRKCSIGKHSIRFSETTFKGLRLPAAEFIHTSMKDKNQPTPDSHAQVSWRHEFNANIPDAEFRLPTFGLIEPDFVKQRTYWRIYSPWLRLASVLVGHGLFRFWKGQG